MQIPNHIAIIMDGNGRWAQKRHFPRIMGHRKGVEAVREIIKSCRELKINYLTLYAFSSENWGRPKEEIDALMGLLESFLKKEFNQLQENGIRLMAIGDLTRLPVSTRETLQKIIVKTSQNREMILTLALSYGSRDEIVRAIQKIGQEIASGSLLPEDISDLEVQAKLDTVGLPDPDLLIRTSGEMRISNFLLWQLAYTELYFTETLWPDFSKEELKRAVSEYGHRQRRFGLTDSQLKRHDNQEETY